MDLINKKNLVVFLGELRQKVFQALLKIAAIFCACQQGTKIQGIDGAVLDDIGHLAINNQLREPFSNRSLTDTGFTYQQWIVLAAPGQNLDHSLYFFLTTYQRVNQALACLLIQIGRKLLQGTGHFFLDSRLLLNVPFNRIRVFVIGHLGGAMGNKIDHINTVDVLLLEDINRVTFLLTEDGH